MLASRVPTVSFGFAVGLNGALSESWSDGAFASAEAIAGPSASNRRLSSSRRRARFGSNPPAAYGSTRRGRREVGRQAAQPPGSGSGRHVQRSNSWCCLRGVAPEDSLYDPHLRGCGRARTSRSEIEMQAFVGPLLPPGSRTTAGTGTPSRAATTANSCPSLADTRKSFRTPSMCRLAWRLA
jgi:hypothetical protein